MSTTDVDFEKYYTQYLNTIKSKVKVAVGQALHDTWADFFPTIDERVRKIFNSVIQDFYSSYSPEYYSRNKSLFNLIQTSVTDDSLNIRFDPTRMTAFRSGYNGEDGLYNQVFRHGWHGGAASGDGHPNPGSPYWRAPVPYFSRWGHRSTFSPISPLDDMKRRVSDYERYEMQSDFNRIWTVHAKNIKID